MAVDLRFFAVVRRAMSSIHPVKQRCRANALQLPGRLPGLPCEQEHAVTSPFLQWSIGTVWMWDVCSRESNRPLLSGPSENE